MAVARLSVGNPPRTLPELAPKHATMQQEVGLHLALAYRVNERLAIGVSPAFLYSRIEVDKPMAQPSAILRGHPVDGSDLTYADAAPFLGVRQIVGTGDMEGARTYGFRIKLGAIWHAGERLSVGLTYAPQSYLLDYLGRVRVDMNRQLEMVDPDGLLLRPTIAANTGIPVDQQDYRGSWNLRLRPQQIPQEVGVGAALWLDRVTLGLDVHWIQWSRTFRTFRARLEDGNSPELNELTADGGHSTTVSIPLRWRDQVVVALGASFAVSEALVVRLGYNYGRNPVPKRYLEPTLPAVFEHHVTGGFSVQLRRFEISAALEYALPVSIDVGAHRANLEYDGSRLDARLFWFSLGIGARF